MFNRNNIKIVQYILSIGFAVLAASCGFITEVNEATSTAEPVIPVTLLPAVTETESTTPAASERGDIWVEIHSPQEGAALDAGSPIHIEGRGQGLFEGNVVVKIETADGELLVEEPTTMSAPEIGEEGPWSIDLSVDISEDTRAMIVAYHESARDGSVVAQDEVSVMLTADSEESQDERGDIWVEITIPQEGATLNASKPIHIEGRGAGLFENNVAISIESEHGEMLAGGSTTLNVLEMGQEGPWKIDMTVDVEQVTLATITAYHASARDGSIVAEDQVSVNLEPAAEGGSLVDTPWILMSFAEGNPVITRFSHTVSMIFDGQTQMVGGVAACNDYSADYVISNSDMMIGEVTRTLIACEDETVMEQEDLFINLLGSVTGYRVSGDWLYLTRQGGVVLMSLQADPVAHSSYTRDLLGDGIYEGLHPVGGTVEMQNGVFEEGDVESNNRVWMALTNHMAFSDLDEDGAVEAVLIVPLNMGGSGTFYQLIAVSQGADQILNVEALTTLGDRIIVNRMSLVEGNQVELDIVVQGPDDPFCCPTQRMLVRYQLADGDWELVSEEVIDSLMP